LGAHVDELSCQVVRDRPNEVILADFVRVPRWNFRSAEQPAQLLDLPQRQIIDVHVPSLRLIPQLANA
jgi:hypothetical protein